MADSSALSAAASSLSALGTDFPTATSDLSSLLSQASDYESIFSDIPTLPPSVLADLSSAAPSSYSTVSDFSSLYCEALTATPTWFSNLPGSDVSALSSYETAISSWEDEHKDVLESITSQYSIELPKCTGTGKAGESSSKDGSSSGSNTASATGSGAETSPTQQTTNAAGVVSFDRAVVAAMVVVGLVGAWIW